MSPQIGSNSFKVMFTFRSLSSVCLFILDPIPKMICPGPQSNLLCRFTLHNFEGYK